MASWKEIDTHAKEWTKTAGKRLRESFKETLNISTKSNRNDLVTNMDKETEEFFITKIKENYPDHRILGEEGMGEGVTDLNGIVWIIDPIDGTMNFIHQQRNFAISIGIYENGVGKIGLIYDVVHDELYHAVKGQGAYMNDVKLQELEPVALSDMILSLNATWVTENKRIDPAILSKLVKDIRGTRSYGSAAIELAYTAAGRVDGYISLRLAPWDVAGGAVLVEEVGGLVTDLRGKPLDLVNGGSVFACRPVLHEEVLKKYLADY
ncbi:inositol monophosphatase family protein [Peribacillus saganii]|uniref:inositol-phosphate phosphatase n=1 Tax=Peribacillus saganii TaxID=2303992 RepID=A0A372LSD6_9BACI|nr:inositol monophosphatase family protein [Peribacillus saganii]RFU71125.1 inositol monophosphatase family protein [Peribacillus saganii]